MALTEEQIKVVSNMTRFGHTQYYIAQALGMSPQNLSKLKSTDPLLVDALNVSSDDLLVDVKSRMFKTAIQGSDKDSNTAASFLLNRYEVNTPTTATTGVTDDDIRDEILDELTT